MVLAKKALESKLASVGWRLVHYEDGSKKSPRFRAVKGGTDQAASSPELLIARCASYDADRARLKQPAAAPVAVAADGSSVAA